MHHSLVVAMTAVLAIAACGGGSGPQNIQVGGGSNYSAPAAGPHDLNSAERGAIQTGLAAKVRGAKAANMVAVRGDDGVVAVCGALSTGAPFYGILMGNGGGVRFSPAGVGLTDPDNRAIRKICAERGLTV